MLELLFCRSTQHHLNEAPQNLHKIHQNPKSMERSGKLAKPSWLGKYPQGNTQPCTQVSPKKIRIASKTRINMVCSTLPEKIIENYMEVEHHDIVLLEDQFSDYQLPNQLFLYFPDYRELKNDSKSIPHPGLYLRSSPNLGAHPGLNCQAANCSNLPGRPPREER